MQKDGFFELRTAADMLKKLRHDFERCRREPIDTYAAFDFVVTGTHLYEWAGKPGIPADPLDALAFKLCGDLGNGAKHFVMQQKRPPGHEIRSGVWERGTWAPGVLAPGSWDEGDLIVHLDAKETKVNDGHASMTILELGKRLLAYWEAIISV